MSPTLFEIVPHPQRPGAWIIKASQRIPYPLRYRELRQAIGYAEWVAKDFENAEIRVYARGGVLQERRVLRRKRHRDNWTPFAAVRKMGLICGGISADGKLNSTKVLR